MEKPDTSEQDLMKLLSEPRLPREIRKNLRWRGKSQKMEIKKMTDAQKSYRGRAFQIARKRPWNRIRQRSRKAGMPTRIIAAHRKLVEFAGDD